MNINNVHFGRSEIFFDVFVRTAKFVLASAVQFNIWTLSNFKLYLCILEVVRNTRQSTYSKCKVASLL